MLSCQSRCSAARQQHQAAGKALSTIMNENSLPQADADPAKPWFKVADSYNSRHLAGWFSVLISLAIIAVALWQTRLHSWAGLARLVPRDPLFWALFAITYLASPVGDWIIFRRLWGLPLAGIGALLRKMVSNDLLLGYLGDAQFYGWARSRLSIVAAPFGAVKDVAILSAVTGNLVTMVMLVFAWPLVSSGHLGVATRDAYISLGIVLASSFAILLFRRQLLSLSRPDLYFISAVHLGRISVVLAGLAMMWHLILQDVSLTLWIVLATLRMLISRLPLLPNKDVVFAGIAVFLLGHQTEVSNLMTLIALLQLGTNLIIGILFGLLGLFEAEKLR